MWYHGDELLSWQTLISKYHNDWKFQKHVKIEFDNIMCWFFAKYQEDIAQMHNCKTNVVKPLPPRELQATNWLSLDLSKILAQMEAEFN